MLFKLSGGDEGVHRAQRAASAHDGPRVTVAPGVPYGRRRTWGYEVRRPPADEMAKFESPWSSSAHPTRCAMGRNIGLTPRRPIRIGDPRSGCGEKFIPRHQLYRRCLFRDVTPWRRRRHRWVIRLAAEHAYAGAARRPIIRMPFDAPINPHVRSI